MSIPRRSLARRAKPTSGVACLGCWLDDVLSRWLADLMSHASCSRTSRPLTTPTLWLRRRVGRARARPFARRRGAHPGEVRAHRRVQVHRRRLEPYVDKDTFSEAPRSSLLLSLPAVASGRVWGAKQPERQRAAPRGEGCGAARRKTHGPGDDLGGLAALLRAFHPPFAVLVTQPRTTAHRIARRLTCTKACAKQGRRRVTRARAQSGV